ncbi:hypothetical protein [Natronorubrum sp. DTA28]|uniref:hypothetical protein n=1 Tax=Natronorubrum sp. DTA28 TaxID=3447019 RepID=UPI003F84D5DB
MGVAIDELSVGAAFLVIAGILLVVASVIVGVSLAERRQFSGPEGEFRWTRDAAGY